MLSRSRSREVTLQQSTAANPEYGDFLCVEAGGCRFKVGGGFSILTLLLDAMSRQSVHRPLCSPCPHKTIAIRLSTHACTNKTLRQECRAVWNILSIYFTHGRYKLNSVDPLNVRGINLHSHYTDLTILLDIFPHGAPSKKHICGW